MTTLIDMIERKNAQLLAQNPSTGQLTERLTQVTDELGDAHQAIDRLHDECLQALAERDQARHERDLSERPIVFEDHTACDVGLAVQQRATRNARLGEVIAIIAAVVFAAAVIVQAFN